MQGLEKWRLYLSHSPQYTHTPHARPPLCCPFTPPYIHTNTSLVAQMVKNPWVRKIPWIRKWLLTLVFLPGEIHGQRSLVGCSLCGHQESDMTERLMHFSLSFAYEKGTGGLPTIPPAADGFCCNEISVWKADGDFCLCTVEESSLRCPARPKSFW